MSQPVGDQPPEPSDDLSGEGVEFIDLDTIARQPPSRRKRVVRLALLVLILGGALAALWRVVPPPFGPPIAPTPTSPMVTATLLSNVNFGTMLVNGQSLAGHPPLTAMLPSQGTTIITLDAPPFRPKNCAFTDLMTPLNDPDCQLVYNEPATPTTRQASPSPGGFTLGVFLTPDDLPPDQQSRALAVMSQPLGAPEQTTVPIGDYIITSISPNKLMLTSQRATTPLLARATFEPSRMPGPLFGGPNCGQGICPLELSQTQGLGLASQSWGLYFTEALRWRFSDPAGTTVADVSIPTLNIVDMILAYQAKIGWQIKFTNTQAVLGSVHGTVCDAGIAVLTVQLGGGTPPAPLHDRGVEGCELHLTVNGVDQGRYVWRFGVLLTADKLARVVMPDLPIASPAEIAAVGG